MKPIYTILAFIALTTNCRNQERTASTSNLDAIDKCNLAKHLHSDHRTDVTYTTYTKVTDGYRLVVSLAGYVDTLDFGLDCNSPKNMLPRVYYLNDRKAYLIQGTGFHYRSMTVCVNLGRSVDCTTFESNRIENDAVDVFVFQEVDKQDKIGTLSIVDSSVKWYTLPKRLKGQRIVESRLFKDSILVKFSGDLAHTIYFSHSDR